MALGSTQPLTEMNTRNISWGVKAAGAWGWQPYHLHVPIVLKSGKLNLLEPSGSVEASNGIALHYCAERHSDTCTNHVLVSVATADVSFSVSYLRYRSVANSVMAARDVISWCHSRTLLLRSFAVRDIVLHSCVWDRECADLGSISTELQGKRHVFLWPTISDFKGFFFFKKLK